MNGCWGDGVRGVPPYGWVLGRRYEWGSVISMLLIHSPFDPGRLHSPLPIGPSKDISYAPSPHHPSCPDSLPPPTALTISTLYVQLFDEEPYLEDLMEYLGGVEVCHLGVIVSITQVYLNMHLSCIIVVHG